MALSSLTMRDILIQELTRASKIVIERHKTTSKEANTISINIEPTKTKEYGDFSSNVALLLAKNIRLPAIDVANQIVLQIDIDKNIVNKILVAKPGFINFYVSANYWSNVLKNILFQKNAFGRSSLGQGKRVLIEFVSANPTGPLHIGHGRCAALGDALSNLLIVAGYDVTKEYYINDTGRQIELLGKSILARYKQIIGSKSEFPEDGYKGVYINEIARMLIASDGKKYSRLPDSELIAQFTKIGAELILNEIATDLKSFGVHFDSWFSEKSLFENKKVSYIISLLQRNGFIYSKDGAQWMRASILGDQKDRVVVRSNGETTYFASDIAYHQDKYERGYDKIIDIWGADHHGYIDRIKAVLIALKHPEDTFSTLLVQLVKLVRNGIPLDMSTRKGTFTTLAELIKEAGSDASRFFFLLRRHDSHLDFDIDLAKKQSAENPVYYCQYAYARICSIERQAKSLDLYVKDPIDFSLLLNLDEEKEILKKLDLYPEIINSAAKNLEPHRITFYLIELSTLFHQYYNSHRVLTDNKQRTIAKLNLLMAIKIVLKSGLNILGISSPEKM